jgi:uncharacterized protein (DUF3084 family)
MARRCACGCGRRLGFKDHLISRRAAKIEREADFLEEHTSRYGWVGWQRADLETFINDGRELRDQLVRVIHGELDARAVDRSQVRDWRGQAKALINEYNMATYPSGGGSVGG